jgi:hypothetical protein
MAQVDEKAREAVASADFFGESLRASSPSAEADFCRRGLSKFQLDLAAPFPSVAKQIDRRSAIEDELEIQLECRDPVATASRSVR